MPSVLEPARMAGGRGARRGAWPSLAAVLLDDGLEAQQRRPDPAHADGLPVLVHQVVNQVVHQAPWWGLQGHGGHQRPR